MRNLVFDRFHRGSILGVAALAMLAAAGCGSDDVGGGGGPGGPAPGVNLGTRGVAAAQPGVPPNAGTPFGTNVNVNINNVPVASFAPVGIPAQVAPGFSVTVIEAGRPFIAGLQAGRAPGDITITPEGGQAIVLTGNNAANLDSSLKTPITLPPGRYTVRIEGPFHLTDGTDRLSIDALQFSGRVRRDGRFPLPTQLAGSVAANNGNTKDTNITATFNGVFDGSTATLTIATVNGNFTQAKPIAASLATFQDQSGGIPIPATGLTLLSLDVNNP